MYKKSIFLLTLLLLNCKDKVVDNDQTESLQNQSPQIVIANAEYNTGYREFNSNELISRENAQLSGRIISSPLPTLYSISMGSEEFNGPLSSIYYPGYLVFGLKEEYPLRTFANIDILNISIETSLGELSGSMMPPILDNLNPITSSARDTLQINEPLVITCLGEFDFIYLSIAFVSKDDHGNVRTQSFEFFEENHIITLPDTLFPCDGHVLYHRVTFVNGPYPQADIKNSNMTGDGEGYFYYQKGSYDLGGIVIGNGINLVSHQSLSKEINIKARPFKNAITEKLKMK